jgi:tRNA threonylcarbamoyladenosine modification (KEOPS) complex  Pcc1 subunit
MEVSIKIKFESEKEALNAAQTLREGAFEDNKNKLEIKTINNLLEVKIETQTIASLRALTASVLRDLKTIIGIKEVMKK